MTVDSGQFKDVLREWASGVTVVTSRHGERVHGMTVSAFASVSLDPPLVLICASKSSNTYEVIEEGRVFAANILAADQQDLSNKFASKKEEHLRFEGLDWQEGATGAPILPGALAALDCRVVAAHDAGDHVIYVGQVEAVVLDEGRPLIYYGAGYRALTERDGEGA